MMTHIVERPILFSGPMVRAIIDGRKAQTRRLVKPQPDTNNVADIKLDLDGFLYVEAGRWCQRCPYGIPGDRLWVRETWADTMGDPPEAIYRADGERHPSSALKWRPSIFMPRWACRLVLEVTAVRVERLQKISEADAKAEGCAAKDLVTHKGTMGPFDAELTQNAATAKEAYRALWNSLNAKRAPWASNPFVWVIEFRMKR